MFLRCHVHMHNNRCSSKYLYDCLHAEVYELYYCKLPLELYNQQVYLHSACANVYYSL